MNITATAPVANAVRLSLRRIYILPTRHGLLFVLALAVMLAGSMNYNNSMGFVLTFLLASMAVVSILHTYHNLAGLRIEAGHVLPVFAGENCRFGIRFDNHGQKARHALKLVRSDKNLPAAAAPPLDISAGARCSAELPVPATRRGRQNLGRVTLGSTFPLGLFYAWSYLDLDMQCIVYPRPGGSYTLPPGKPEQGKQSTRYGETGEDFAGYRDYTLSDSPRHVDWKIVARDKGWFVKRFGGQSGLRLWLTWDDVRGARNTEHALAQLSRWVVQAEAGQLAYGLEIPGTRLDPDQGAAHYHRCLEALALFGGR